MEHYSHIPEKAKEAAIEGLETRNQSPEISEGWAQNCAESEGEKRSGNEKTLEFTGATRRIRTDDLLITNQLLYRLS